MLNPKQVAIRCITLLCLEHRPGVSTSPSFNIVKEIIAQLPQPDTTLDVEEGRKIFSELVKTVIWLTNVKEFPTDSEVLQQVKLACKEEEYLYEALAIPLSDQYESPLEVVKQIQSYRRSLAEYVNEKSITDILKEYHHKAVFKRGSTVDLRELVSEMAQRLEPLVQTREKYTHPAQMGTIDFGDVETIEESFQAVKNVLSSDGGFKMGWQALNRMLGKTGILKRGEFVIVGGLQHNFKSGFMLSMFVHACLFNKPWMRDPAKKPLIQFISFENEVSDNLLWIYKYLKENETKEPVLEGDIDIKEASQYVAGRLRETGFEVRMDRFDPTEFSANALVSHLDSLQAEGFEIQLLIVDYLNMLPKTGMDAKVAGDDIRLLFRRVRNYTSSRGITFVSPHQLSSDALQLTRDNVDDFVRVIANKGYYDGCRRLGQEPDLEIMIHKVVVNGKSYLTVGRGKHRNVITPTDDQYFVLPFQDVGTLPWDIDGEDTSVAAPGGGARGSVDEIPWWEAA